MAELSGPNGTEFHYNLGTFGVTQADQPRLVATLNALSRVRECQVVGHTLIVTLDMRGIPAHKQAQEKDLTRAQILGAIRHRAAHPATVGDSSEVYIS